MARERLTDRQGRTIAYLEDTQSRIFIYTRTGTKLGYYDKRQDRTFDNIGRAVGSGNQLTMLIPHD